MLAGISPALVILGGLATTVVATSWSVRAQQREVAQFDEARLDAIAELLKADSKIVVSSLYGLRGFYESSDSVDRDEFAHFATHLRSNHVRAWAWLPIVSGDNLDEFTHQLRDSISTGSDDKLVSIGDVEPPRRLEHVLVGSLEPLEGNEDLIGIDLASDAESLTAFQRARVTATPVMSPGVEVAQGPEESFTLFTVLPVHRLDLGGPSSHLGVVGFVAALIEADQMMEQVVAQTNSDFHVEIAPRVGNSGTASIHRTAPDGIVSEQTRSVDVADQRWEIRLINPGIRRWYSSRILWVPFFGLVATAAVGLATFAATRARAQAERIAETRTRQLTRANGVLGDFVHVMSHDLRSPLRGIRTLVQFMHEDLAEVPDNVGDYLAQIDGRATKLQTLLDDITTYLHSNQQEVEVEMIDVEATVRDAIDVLPVPEYLDIELQIDLEEPVGVAAVPFTTCLRNLVDNAIKYHPGPSGVISIEATRRGDRLAVTVADDGAGIERAYQEKVFKPFTKLETETSVDGSGLGLAIVQRIIDRLDGSISLESGDGRGSTFALEFPILDPSSARQGRLANPKTHPASRRASERKSVHA